MFENGNKDKLSFVFFFFEVLQNGLLFSFLFGNIVFICLSSFKEVLFAEKHCGFVKFHTVQNYGFFFGSLPYLLSRYLLCHLAYFAMLIK